MVKLVLLICLLAVSSAFALECAHRNYGHGSTVCVCNATYCDDIKPLEKTAKGIVTSYVSSQTGDRFAKTQLHFSNEAPKGQQPAITVNIDHNKKYQKIIGFGGAFTDSAGINIAKLPKDLQTRLIRDYFASDGIEYTLGRIPIGGSDFSTRPYAYNEHPDDDNLTKFELELEDFHYKIPYLLLAQEVSPHTVRYYGSPWSSPKWIKTNHEINHGGLIIGKPGERYYKIFAKYFIRFIEAYTKNKVHIWGLTIENEPGAGYNKGYKWNSLGFNKELERDFVRLDLGPELHSHGYTRDKLKLMIYDDQLPRARSFADAVLSDKEAAKYVAGIAFHWYSNNNANWTDLDWLNQHYQDYFLLATEACEEWKGKTEHVSLGNWATFNRYALDILKNMNHFSTGWTDWNLVLDLQGGPNWVGNFVDAPIIVNETSQEYYKQPFYYALGHFSKFLVPDSVRLHHEAHTADTSLLLTVFQRPDNGTVLIILNTNAHPVVMQVHDPLNGYLDVSLKPHAMETLIWY